MFILYAHAEKNLENRDGESKVMQQSLPELALLPVFQLSIFVEEGIFFIYLFGT